jgi:hypothetical protein
MGRIGRSYPRFQPQPAQAQPLRRGRTGSRLAGALIGLLAALGLIGWLLKR